MKRGPHDIVTAWRKAEDAVGDIGDARRSAEYAVEDVLDALRSLTHGDDRVRRLRRDTKKSSGGVRARFYGAANTSRDAATADRIAVFAAGLATGLVAGWWIGRALSTVDVRGSTARLLTPVAEKSRGAVERPRTVLEGAVERPVAAVRDMVGRRDDTDDGPGVEPAVDSR
jgi:hypothetical protein